MANYDVASAKHATLAPNQEDVVKLSNNTNVVVEVLNRSDAGYIYFTTDGSPAVVAGDNNYVVGPMSAVPVYTGSGADEIHLKANSAVAYSVTGTSTQR